MEAAQQSADAIRVGALEIHPTDGLALADGNALTLSVREFGLLVALARSGGGIVRREDLYRRVWGGALRDGDRSIDVYVHKLRVKLAQALPELQFIHTHVGFGYRFAPVRAAGERHDHEESL
jgi:DNA-binding response OmpR family regulator